jgi:hypothetical protein
MSKPDGPVSQSSISSISSIIVWTVLVSGAWMALCPPALTGQSGGQKKGSEKKEGTKETGKKPAEGEEPEEASSKDEGKGEGRKLSVDLAYVQENLKPLLNADKLEFDQDGGVTIEYDFSKKKQEHMEVFEPPISSKLQSNFRYTTGREEHMDYFEMEGIKIANQGRAVLKCWFLDDVEAEVEYIGRGSFTPGHVFALCFSDAKNTKALGANLGSQCVTLNGGVPAGKRQGTADPIPNATRVKVKLVVRGGKFEAYKSDRKLATMEYKPADFKTGQIGFAWCGKIAGSVTYLKIKGRLDAKKTAEMLRKSGRQG